MKARHILWLILVGGLAWGGVELAADLASIPTVRESYPTGECVKVEYPDGTLGSCDDLPERYHHVWVQ